MKDESQSISKKVTEA